jgi:hypothetical protein
MNCDRAGELLGAYLRGELMASTRAEVQAHLDTCASCRADLDTYRLVYELPRVEPSAALQERLFSSHEFQEIAHAVRLQHTSGGALIEGSTPENHHTPVGDSISANGNGHYSHLQVLRPSGPVSNGGSTGNRRPVVSAEGKIRRIDWQRMAIRMAVAAAVLVLVLGSAVVAKTVLPQQQTVAQNPTFDPAGPVPGPLAAGSRLVYLHNGRLWSAPKNGAQVRSPLTDTSVTVAPGWAVAPTVGPKGAHHLAYIDLKTGLLHFIQTDDRGDVTVGRVAPQGADLKTFWQSTEGQAVLAGLAWASDARQIAYVADPDGAGAALWVVNADGSGARPVSGEASKDVLPSLPAWSPDGSNLAYVLTSKGASSIWDTAFDGSTPQMLEAQASPQGDAGDVVRGLFWTSDTITPTVTWSAGKASSTLINGLWSYRLNQSPHLMRLTQPGASFSTVDYSMQAGNVGSWLVGEVGVGLVSVHADGSESKGLAPGTIVAATWAANSPSALYVVAQSGATTGALWTWTPLLGQRQIATDVALSPLPVWSPDAQHVLYVANGQSWVAQTSGHSVALSGTSASTALSWASDASRIALADSKGITLSNPDGSAAHQVDDVSGVDEMVWTAVP